MHENIVIVDDEPDILELLTVELQKNHFRVKAFSTGTSFLIHLDSHKPDLVILDLMLPDADGFEICKYMRKKTSLASVPLIMLTARADENNRVLGLELGADDYMVKPFSPRELIARVRALLRRSTEQIERPSRIEHGDIILDTNKHAVSVRGTPVDLTSTEFGILHLLMSKRGWVFSREKILDHLWGEQKIVLDRTVDVHVKHLRSKLGEAGGMIRNVRGVGYKFEE